MEGQQKPFFIDFPEKGDDQVGFIGISEFESSIPFKVKRCFWTYYTPETVERGKHAQYETEQVLIAVAGQIVVNVQYAHSKVERYVLDRPNRGIYLPPKTWHTMQYSQNAVQLVFASTLYNKNDYIRDHEEFKRLYG